VVHLIQSALPIIVVDGLADVGLIRCAFQVEVVDGVRDIALLGISVRLDVHCVKPQVQQNSIQL